MASSLSVSSVEDKRLRVERLVEELSADLSDHHLSSKDRLAFTRELKVCGRDTTGSDAIFTAKGIQTLGRCVFESASKTAEYALEAMRCLANALFLVEDTRRIYIEAGFVDPTIDLLEDASPDYEFLASRILFFLSYEPSLDLKDIVMRTQIQKLVRNILRRHAAIFPPEGPKRAPSTLDDMALVDVLKLVFNYTHHIPGEGIFTDCLESILFLLRARSVPEQPLQSPICFLVNAASNIGLAPQDPIVYPPTHKSMNVRHLIGILDSALSDHPDSLRYFEQNGAPLLHLIRKFHSFAPKEVKDYMRKRLLPSESERDQPLGRGGSLAARLLRLSTSIIGHVGPSAGSLLFELSSNDADEFVRNVGLGFASGFLASNGIALPSTTTDTSSSPIGTARPLNPITGQALDAEPPQEDPFASMSEEEREREAEKLFVLFERLRATGVVDVQNPVQQAVDSGRFQEIDDEEDSD